MRKENNDDDDGRDDRSKQCYGTICYTFAGNQRRSDNILINLSNHKMITKRFVFYIAK